MAGTLVHYDGVAFKGWTAFADGSVVAIHPDLAGSAWAFSEDGAILRASPQSPPTVVARFPAAARQTWHVTGDSGAIFAERDPELAKGEMLRWDGQQWGAGPEHGWMSANAVWAAAPGRLIALTSGSIKEYDGSHWAASLQLPPLTQLMDIWGHAPDDIWAVGRADVALDRTEARTYHWAAGTWSPAAVPAVAGLRKVTGDSSGRLWALFEAPDFYGNSGLAAFDGGTWRVVFTTAEAISRFNGLAALEPEQVVLAGVGVAVFGKGGEVSRLDCGVNGFNLLRVAGTNTNDLWALGHQEHDGAVTASVLYHFDGGAWTSRVWQQQLDALAPGAQREVWLAGSTLNHFDGSTWSVVPLPTGLPLRAIRIDQRGWLWAGDSRGALSRWNGSSWLTIANKPATADPAVIWVDSDNVLWWIDTAGVALRYQNDAWTNLDTGEGGAPAFFGRTPSDVWLTTYQPAAPGASQGRLRAFHWDGSRLNLEGELDLHGPVHGLWTASPDAVWLVGEDGIYRASAGAVSSVADGVHTLPISYQAIAGAGPDDAWAVGARGEVAHWDGNSWTQQRSGCGNWLADVWSDGSNVVAVGAADTIIRRR